MVTRRSTVEPDAVELDRAKANQLSSRRRIIHAFAVFAATVMVLTAFAGLSNPARADVSSPSTASSGTAGSTVYVPEPPCRH